VLQESPYQKRRDFLAGLDFKMGNRGDVFFLLVLVLLVLPLISAQDIAFYVEKNTNYSIQFSCNIDGSMCSNEASCNATITNTTTLMADVATSNLLNARFEHNITNNETATPGEYTLKIDCVDGNSNGTSTIIYEVNGAGIRSSEQRTQALSRSIYFIFGIGILLFIAFLFASQSVPAKWTFFIFSVLFFLIGINILFIGLQDEGINPRLENFFDGFTVISWYFYWFAAGLLIIIWAFTFFNTWFYKKNLRNVQRFGGD